MKRVKIWFYKRRARRLVLMLAHHYATSDAGTFIADMMTTAPVHAWHAELARTKAWLRANDPKYPKARQ